MVLTVSDRAYKGLYRDLSGPAIERILHEQISGVIIERRIVPDERELILSAFEDEQSTDCIITTGGTGLSPRDVTPEITMEYCDRLVPGIAETLRFQSYNEMPNAMLSRGVAGIKGRTLIINLPGSTSAIETCMNILVPVLTHAMKMIAGEGHSSDHS